MPAKIKYQPVEHPCSNCGYPLVGDENCPVCVVVDRMKIRHREKKRIGFRLTLTQPKEA